MSTPSPLPAAPRINRTGLAWREFNSLPATPPPGTDPEGVHPPVLNRPVHSKARVLSVVAGAFAVGVVAGLFVFYPRSKARGKAPLARSVIATAAVPTKPEEAARTKPVVLPVVPLAIPTDVPEPAEAPIEIAAQREEIPRPVHKNAYLDAKPKKAERPGAPHVGPKSRGPQVAAPPPPNDTKADPKEAPSATPVEDFGMSLRRPTTSRPTRKIDETDPYAP